MRTGVWVMGQGYGPGYGQGRRWRDGAARCATVGQYHLWGCHSDPAAHVGDEHREVVMSSTGETATGIRPFHVDIPEEKLTDLRRRIEATQWPEKETVADQSQGVPLATI